MTDRETMEIIEELIWTTTMLQAARASNGIDGAVRQYMEAAQTHSLRAVAMLQRLVSRMESGVAA